MKSAAFSDALQFLSDDLLTEARPLSREKTGSRAWMAWAAAAACMALVIWAGGQVNSAPAPVTPGTEAAEPVTPVEPVEGERALIYSAPGGEDEQACYMAPGPGESICSRGVQAALEEHKGYGVAYLVAFDLFTEDGIATNEEKAAEYRRLAEAGVELFETPMWEYEGPEGAHRNYTVVTAMVTAEELAGFPVSSDYGCFFYFPCNGDSSRPEHVPGEALVLPDW